MQTIEQRLAPYQVTSVRPRAVHWHCIDSASAENGLLAIEQDIAAMGLQGTSRAEISDLVWESFYDGVAEADLAAND